MKRPLDTPERKIKRRERERQNIIEKVTRKGYIEKVILQEKVT